MHFLRSATTSKSRSLVGYHSAIESLLVRSYSSTMTKKNGSKGENKNGSQGKKPDHTHAPTINKPKPSCMLEFDGSSKANGQAGAGAVLRADNGSMTCHLREGLGTADSSTAEYRAIILGLKYALQKGFTHIRVRGDSKTVCMQIQEQVKVKSRRISTLCEQAKQLKARFLSFKIEHVSRKLNTEADKQASLAVTLTDGHIEEEIEK
ncbi:unnamed protein product [Cuscuta epithymum]|uniref:RNase H type-1 domain-containing protein n=1 Tax=Cuscuta epithymum TaxID=186058 RepID=A0AAV0CIN9_9ASTE|nr:unnamed protein product [Cuscuta epithymum]